MAARRKTAAASNGKVRQQSADAYEGANTSTKRRQVSTALWAEDKHLPRSKRRSLTASTRDLIRNFSIACWMVRKHLDYVSRFTFQAKTDDEVLNSEIERVVNLRSRRQRCDASYRHSLARLLRIAEGRSVIDGDILFRKLAPRGDVFNRGRLQLFESELVNDEGAPKPRSDTLQWVNGVLVGPATQPLAYSIHRRLERGTQFAEVIPATEGYLHAYWDSSLRADQVRGVSPLAAAANDMRDVAEGKALAMAKLKVHQMFGLVITRQADATTGYGQSNSGTEYEVDVSDGPFQLDMDPGDAANFLESGTPATETVDFLQLVVHLALKALNIPFSFFREDFTNFFGSRAALLHYLRSCETRIRDLQELLDWITQWWLGLAVVDGELMLPRGVEFETLQWEWIPDGVPWWDPSKEINGHILAVQYNFDNVDRICRSTGTDFAENVRINARLKQYAADMGVPLPDNSMVTNGQQPDATEDDIQAD